MSRVSRLLTIACPAIALLGFGAGCSGGGGDDVELAPTPEGVQLLEPGPAPPLDPSISGGSEVDPSAP